MRTEEFRLGAVTHQHMLSQANEHATARLYDSIGSHLQRIGTPYHLAHPFHETAYRHYTKEADIADSAKPVGVKSYVGKDFYNRRPRNEEKN